MFGDDDDVIEAGCHIEGLKVEGLKVKGQKSDEFMLSFVLHIKSLAASAAHFVFV